ncbi:cytochrome c biogenesis protein transmembrane region [Solidesulfovibrio fructosivorans JJ]]|uniref:Cytochrome c biogenesis protein transmembrane region n=1 Tax=Solidesulfovibrio fructosivorans JJ] TaxID=596151 RepID=E1JY22_SOLFR|nr:protein-disulfide reductase DsbD [Solidesulfovibrio fructosivorans]EFL50760.1 cytochrome c biogenesis protein transmembrane region [Solidesulfovibrio fructosivorans JJ]]
MSRAVSWTYILAFFVALILSPAGASARTPAPADAVFRLDVARSGGGDLVCTWNIAPGHYLYKDRIEVTTNGGKAVPLALPPGVEKDDPTFGSTQVYHNHVSVSLARSALPSSGAIQVTYQGCAEHGVCYPPVHKRIDLATLALTPGKKGPVADVAPPAGTSQTAHGKPDGALASVLSGGLPAMVFSFLGFGLLLAFTPCVFPMVPILSGMLARSGQDLSARKGLVLSGAYVLAMALAYAALGVVAAWSGQNLQVMLQRPAAIILMGLVLVALSLSMFGLYDLALPASLTARLSRATGRAGSSVGGAALLGFGSALIVGPCVTPPLAAALLYVAQTGDVTRGAVALFALGLGMGMPLLAFGLFGGKLLPKSGPWLVTVKQVFGFLFLGLAIWMLGRVLPGQVIRGLWGLLAIAAGVWFGLLRSHGYGMRLAGGGIALGGVLLLTISLGVFPFSCPLAICAGAPAASTDGADVSVRKVRTMDGFDAAMAEARAKGRPILVDFSADWCVVCREIDREVMADAAVVPRLRNVSILRVDVTADTPESRALMRRFDVVGPPTMLFVNAHTGREIDNSRSIGAVSVAQFLRTLGKVGV